MIKLRDYQHETVEAIRYAYRQGKRAPLVALSTGGGKTTIFCYVAQSAAAKSGIVFIVAHREELIKQIADTLARSGQSHRVVSNDSVVRQCKIEQFKKYGKSYVDHSASVYVASVQTLINRFDQVPDPTLVIIDECFPSGTLIDGKPIEKIKINDMVRSVNHNSGIIELKRVTTLFKSKPSELCTIRFDDGSEMTCTTGHPIFVIGKGYINAKEVKRGMPAFRLQDMREESGDKQLLSKRKDEKGCFSSVVRVESVSIHKQTSDGTFGGLCEDGYVYNIEVESNHNYFAGDVLVHNCHHVVEDNQWGKIVNQFPLARLLMVTATPIRSDGKGLGKGHGGFADELIQGKSMKWLVEQGYLSPYRYFAPPTDIDLTNVNTTAKGDYNTKKLSDAVDKPTITGDAVKHYLALAKGKRAVVFCVSVAHAMHVSQQFNDEGVSSEFIEGKTDDRAAMIERFAKAQTMVLTSCDLISEGFDLPAIEVAILLRPTKSTSLFMQQVGRALRIFEGKTEAIILDHVQAWKSHGFPDDEREWSLEGVKKRKRTKADDDEPNVDIKHCPNCYAIHAPAPVCPNCGHEYPITARKLEQVEGELVEIYPQEIERKKARIEQGKAQSVEALMALGKPRKQSEMIVQARIEKQALIESIMSGLNAAYRTKKQTSMEAFGVTSLDVRKMKPKALKELKQRIEAMLNA